MKKKVIIILIILFSIIGIYFFVQYNFNNSSVSSSILKKIESEWNSSENIGRINNSNEEITFKKTEIVVVLNEKKFGDINSKEPLIIDLNNENIIVKNGIFSKSCDADFIKNIQQSFKLETGLTFVTTNISGKINYKVNYEIKGNKNYDEAKEIIENLIMKDIYDNAKSQIKFGIPEINTTDFKPKKAEKINTESLIKL